MILSIQSRLRMILPLVRNYSVEHTESPSFNYGENVNTRCSCSPDQEVIVVENSCLGLTLSFEY